jgi:hypothetical protein
MLINYELQERDIINKQKKQKKKTDPRSENGRSGRTQAKLVLRMVTTQLDRPSSPHVT